MTEIAGVATSTSGFVGETVRGPTEPALVTSWSEFERAFGGYLDGAPLNRTAGIFLPYAVRGFFDNGGRRLFVARITRDPAEALAGLMAIPEIAVMAAPDDVTDDRLRDALLDACDERRDRFAITSAHAATSNPAGLFPPRHSSYAAFYYPWLRVAAPHLRAGERLIPPTGHVAGIYARVDTEHGVHRAPANETVRGILGPEFPITKQAQDVLNPRGVNVIRDFAPNGPGVRVWGARTMSSDPEWKYVNIRRLLIYLEQSIRRGIQWVVFEPNVDTTWLAVRSSVENFLRTVWRTGALQGSTDRQAYFVHCDRTTMTQDDIDNGRLVCEIGVAPVKPAEFVIFRIGQRTCP